MPQGILDNPEIIEQSKRTHTEESKQEKGETQNQSKSAEIKAENHECQLQNDKIEAKVHEFED